MEGRFFARDGPQGLALNYKTGYGFADLTLVPRLPIAPPASGWTCECLADEVLKIDMNDSF